VNTLIIHGDQGRHRISRHLYGHFAEHLARCIYDGIWVGPDSPIPNTRGIRNDVVAALRNLRAPNIRWPGGNFAEMYHWKEGVGPPEGRRTIDIGGTPESHQFGTHEFMDLCDQVGCEPYFCGNVSRGTPEEMLDWIDYLTSPGGTEMAELRKQNGREQPWQVTLWAVGNENWSSMKPDEYAEAYLRFAPKLRHVGGGTLYKVACGPGGENYEWTEVVMKQAAHAMDGLAFHHYTVPGPWEDKGSATQFAEADWMLTMQKALEIEGFIERHFAIMDKYDPERRVTLVMDEWGTWYNPEPGYDRPSHYQQNTLRDVIVAGVTLHMFHRHCDRMPIANIAQTVNVLQAIALTDGERMFLTPTYHLLEMYKVHQDAILLPMELAGGPVTCGDEAVPALSASASRDADGKVHLSLCNLDPNRDLAVSCALQGMAASTVAGRALTADAMNAHNTFDEPDRLVPTAFDGARLEGDGRLAVELPSKSAVVLELT